MYTYKWNQIPGAIAAVKTDSGKLQDKIHNVACSILSEWARNPKRGQEAAQLLTNLANASPYHGQSVADWIGLVTPLQWSEEKETFYAHKGQKFPKASLDYAKANPFWEISKPKKIRNPLTNEALVGMLEAILTKQDKANKKPVEGDDFSTAANKHIREAIKALGEPEAT